MMRRGDGVSVLARALLVSFLGAWLGACEAPQDKEQLYLEVASELRCPTCTGLSVLGSDAPFSTQIKDVVKEQVEAGKSEKEILDYFTARYGSWILRSPPTSGFNLVAWVVPAAVLALGPIGVWFAVWRRRRLVLNTQGMRSAEEIAREMHEALDEMRAARSTKRGGASVGHNAQRGAPA